MGKLSRRESRTLEDLVLRNKSEINESRMSAESVAEIATKALGKEVSTQNVRAAGRVVSVSFPKGQGLQGTTELRAAIRVLARELDQLAGELGHTISPEIKALINVGSA